LRAGPMLLLISKGNSGSPEQTALWHFGWGDVSLGETYLAHARNEVAWEPPLPAGRLHLHVRSINPVVAAEWYRDVLGARAAFAPPPRPADRDAPLPPPEHRLPEALVWLGDTALLLYRTEPPIFSTRGKRADHIALSCGDLDETLARLTARGIEVLEAPQARGRWRTAMVRGPDQMAIELVEAS
jgi:catechol 2,3-dioxygenase-like lactoylglutathione lyase family enzyme